MLVATRLVTCSHGLMAAPPRAVALFGTGTGAGTGTGVVAAAASRSALHSHIHRLSTRRVVCRTAASVGTITTLEPPGWVEEETVRKSRFVAHAAPASSWPEAKAFIADVSDPKARHNCWGWVGAETARSSDDGEPSG